MKLCTFRVGRRVSYGVLASDGRILDLSSRIGREYPDLLSVLRRDGWAHARQVVNDTLQGDYAEAEVEFLPILGGDIAIHCVGLNYKAHIAESERAAPGFPRTFFKVPAALVGHMQSYEMPSLSPEFDFEGELAVVIGKPARSIQASAALEHVCGYTCFMDGSVRDWQLGRTLDQGKNFYKSSSIGPYLTTRDEVGPIATLTMTTTVSGEVMQHTAFEKMIFSVSELIEYISAFTELRVGDVIATGTPEGVGHRRKPQRFLRPGDRVEVAIDRVGILINDVR